jgi:hypothetical protein
MSLLSTQQSISLGSFFGVAEDDPCESLINLDVCRDVLAGFTEVEPANFLRGGGIVFLAKRLVVGETPFPLYL